MAFVIAICQDILVNAKLNRQGMVQKSGNTLNRAGQPLSILVIGQRLRGADGGSFLNKLVQRSPSK
jgi:hypothetical protein